MGKFDKLKADGMRMAEKCCCRLRMGLVQFSPELNQWRLQKELWRLVIRCKVSHHVKATTIHRLATRLHITDPLAKTLKEATMLFQYASTKYKDLKPNHEALRQSFLLA